jgi:hypothetical protein
MYSTVTAFISSIIYSTLVCCPRQSTHQVMPCVMKVFTGADIHMPNIEREMILIDSTKYSNRW